MRKVHQNIILSGIDFGDKQSRKHSNFCNEGKWNNFIKPLLPEDCSDMTLLEIGCSAGLFLKMSKDKGFRNVIGIEQSRREYRASIEYRDSLNMDYKILNAFIDESFNFDELPVVDVVLLANLHYHLCVQDLVHLIDNLEHKTRYCLIVSVEDLPNSKKAHWKASPHLTDVKRYFKNWQEIRVIDQISMEGDPHPRKMYSVLFESQLKRVPLEMIKRKDDAIFVDNDEGVSEFVDKVIKNESIDVRRVWYCRRTIKQKTRKGISIEEALNFFEDKKKVIRDVVENGMRKPLIINTEYRIDDGIHRLTTRRMLGYKSVIVRAL